MLSVRLDDDDDDDDDETWSKFLIKWIPTWLYKLQHVEEMVVVSVTRIAKLPACDFEAN